MATTLAEDLRRRFADAVKLEGHARSLYGYDAISSGGLPEAVVFPRDADDLAFLLEIARTHRVGLVARGSGTGLSGGAAALAGTISVSFERLHRVLSLSPARRRAWVEAGHVNAHLEAEVRPHGLFYPPDPASHRVSSIGGNVAENAGGPHAVKYGVTGQHVVGLSVVDAAGRSGTLQAGTVQPWADLVSLCVGSEGTLCFVLAAELVLAPRPEDVATLLVSFAGMDAATDFVSAVVAQGMIPATLEFLDRAHIEAIEAWGVAHYPEGAGAVLLIEYDGTQAEVLRDVARTEKLAGERGALGCVTTRDAAERDALWLGRRGAYAVIARYGRRVLTQDVTVPRARLTQMLVDVERIAQEYGLRVATVGHAGDGNLHPCFPYDPDEADLAQRVHVASDAVMRACVALDGSISGEHGIGEEKLHQMAIMYGPEELGLMAQVRRGLDPGCLLNPGKAVPDVPRALPAGEGAACPQPRDGEEVRLAVLDARRRGEGLRISLRGLRGVEVDLPNLTVRAAAGTPLADIAQALRDTPFGLPVGPLRSGSIAQAVLLNDYGPEHILSGTWRNHLLAAEYVTGAGERVRMGRPVVKNVAGYDLFRLLIGSRGTLAVPLSFTFRLLPRREEGWWRLEPLLPDELVRRVPAGAIAAFARPRGPSYVLYARLPEPARGWDEAPDAPAELERLRRSLADPGDLLDLSLADTELAAVMAAAETPPAVVLPMAARVLVRVGRAEAERLTVQAADQGTHAVRATWGPRHLVLHRERALEASWRETLERVFDPGGILHWFGEEGS